MSLIGKSNHESVLNSDSLLYKSEQKKTEKQKWAEMDFRQRRQYFMDYYLLKFAIILIIAGTVILLLLSIFSPKKETLLSVCFLQQLDIEEKNNLQNAFEKLLIQDTEKQEIRIDDYFPNRYESEIKLQAYLSGQDIDLIIAEEKQFAEFASFGYFADLNDCIPNADQLYGKLLYRTKGYVDRTEKNKTTDSTDQIEDNNTNDAMIRAYGLRIPNHFFPSLKSDSSHLIAGIVVNSEQKNYAKAAIDLLSK